MNLECTLLNQDSYNYQEYHTVSERTFFHWLKSFEKRYNNSKLSLDRTQNGNDVYYKENKDNKHRIV